MGSGTLKLGQEGRMEGDYCLHSRFLVNEHWKRTGKLKVISQGKSPVSQSVGQLQLPAKGQG